MTAPPVAKRSCRQSGTCSPSIVTMPMPASVLAPVSIVCAGIAWLDEDHAGWSLDGYVIPRLASGMHFAEEVHRGP